MTTITTITTITTTGNTHGKTVQDDLHERHDLKRLGPDHDLVVKLIHEVVDLVQHELSRAVAAAGGFVRQHFSKKRVGRGVTIDACGARVGVRMGGVTRPTLGTC